MWELFSRREAKKANAGVEDVYQYSTLPNTLRVQFIHIMNEAMGRVSMYDQTIPPNVSWNAIANTMRDEKGLFKLTQKPTNNTQEECYHYIMDATALDVIDLIEYAFIVVVTYGKSLADYQRQNYELCDPDDAIKKLNRRFKEHSVGYEFSGRRIIRVDSTFIHSEAVKPALQLMSASKLFAGKRSRPLRSRGFAGRVGVA